MDIIGIVASSRGGRAGGHGQAFDEIHHCWWGDSRCARRERETKAQGEWNWNFEFAFLQTSSSRSLCVNVTIGMNAPCLLSIFLCSLGSQRYYVVPLATNQDRHYGGDWHVWPTPAAFVRHFCLQGISAASFLRNRTDSTYMYASDPYVDLHQLTYKSC